MNILIAGSRDTQSLTISQFHTLCSFYLHRFLNDPDTTIIAGGAKGIDTWAGWFAASKGISFQEFPADWTPGGQFKRNAGMVRNAQMVKNADLALFFWDGRSSGTKQCITLAKKKGIPLKIINLQSINKYLSAAAAR